MFYYVSIMMAYACTGFWGVLKASSEAEALQVGERLAIANAQKELKTEKVDFAWDWADVTPVHIGANSNQRMFVKNQDGVDVFAVPPWGNEKRSPEELLQQGWTEIFQEV